jgi:NAD(P)H-hydrate epimerase
MIPLLNADEMRSLETRAIEGWGIPSVVLQEHAAMGALEMLPRGEPIHVLAGPGNNGGDALALARLARLRGDRVEVWTPEADPVWRGDAALQASLWEGLGGTYRHSEQPREVVAHFTGWVVDGLFGLGVRLPIRGAAAGWIQALHDAVFEAGGAAPFKVLALDLPSGLDPSSSEVSGPTVLATQTACFGLRKICHGLRPARLFCGETKVIPIPLNRQPSEPVTAGLWLTEAPGRPRWGAWDTHKRDFGHVGIRAGTVGMSGAAVLAALGALRAGAGLVTVLPDPEVRAEVAAQLPEAMVQPWHGELPAGIDVLLVGPGGVAEVPAWDGPLVVDASALRAGQGPGWMARPETVLTPHPGEFARLFGLEKSPSQRTSERLARVAEVTTGPAILVLKGAQSIIAGGGPRIVVNSTGHRGLSTGGTGDLLAGMVAAKVAFWAQERSRHPATGTVALQAAVAEAVWLHGAAADRLGAGPLLVRELADSLAALQRELQREWGLA